MDYIDFGNISMKFKKLLLSFGLGGSIGGLIVGALAGNFACDIINDFLIKLFRYTMQHYFIGIVLLINALFILLLFYFAPKKKYEYVFVNNPFKDKSVAQMKYSILKFIAAMEKQGYILVEMPMREDAWLFKKKKGTPTAKINIEIVSKENYN